MDYESKRPEPGFPDSESSALFNTAQETKDWGVNRATTGFQLEMELS